MLERWDGRFDAAEVARGIEYDWHPGRPGSYGELVQHQMPHWRGDKRRWETRAHVGFEGTPQANLDRLGAQVLKQGWAPAGRRPLRRTFRRSAEGAKWEMTLALRDANATGARDLVVTIVQAGR